MNPEDLAKMHGVLCIMHNDLSAAITEMPETDALYQQANNTANALYRAAGEAYKLLRYSQPQT